MINYGDGFPEPLHYSTLVQRTKSPLKLIARSNSEYFARIQIDRHHD